MPAFYGHRFFSSRLLSLTCAGIFVTIVTAQAADLAPAASAAPAPVATATPAKTNVGVAVLVNDQPVTFGDIDNRAALYTMGIPPADDAALAQLKAQVLYKLVDEKLQMQEAQSLGISVSDAEVQQAFATVAQKNGMSPDAFREKMQTAGIRFSTMQEQLRAELAWGQVIRRKLRPQINVGDADVEAAFDILEKQGKAKPAGSAPAVTPDTPATETTATPAEGVIIAKAGETASTPAPETAPTPEASPAAPATRKGNVIALKQIMIPLSPEDPAEIVGAKMARAEKLAEEVTSCGAFDAKMVEFQSPGTLDMGRGPEDGLPPALQEIVKPLPVGKVSKPVRTGDGRGIALLIVCDRVEVDLPADGSVAVSGGALLDRTNPADREKVTNQLGLERLNKLAERYLRDLRATAFIDKRM